MANALSGWLNNSEHPFEPSSIWAVPDGPNQHQHSRIASFYCLLLQHFSSLSPFGHDRFRSELCSTPSDLLPAWQSSFISILADALGGFGPFDKLATPPCRLR
jgi:hypothetical protein